jgi:hypothetical protein
MPIHDSWISFIFAFFIYLPVLGPQKEIFSMNATSETNTGTSRRAEQQTFIVLGVLLQFLSTPEQINDQISVNARNGALRSRDSTS